MARTTWYQKVVFDLIDVYGKYRQEDIDKIRCISVWDI